MGMLLKISQTIDGLTRLVGRTIIWLILTATLISAGNAIARKLLNVGSNAYLEIQWYLFAAVFMCGAGYAFLQNAHVRIDVLANKLSKRTRMYIDIFGILFFMLPMCYLISYFSWPVLDAAFQSGEMSSNAGGLIRWPLYALLPAGFALLGLQGVSELIKRIAFLAGKGPDPLAHESDAAHAAADAPTHRATEENVSGEAQK